MRAAPGAESEASARTRSSVQRAALVLAALAAARPAPALPLAEAVRLAIEASPELKRAAADLVQARIEEPALESETDPTVLAEASSLDDQAPRAAPAFEGAFTKATRLEAAVEQKWLTGTQARLGLASRRLENPAAFRVLDPTVDTRLALTVRQPLLRNFWGRPDRARRGQARAGVSAAEAALERLRDETAVRAGAAYLEALFALGNLEIRKAAEADARRLGDTYKRKARYGVVEEVDLRQADALVAAREIETRRAESGLTLALQSLSDAVGAPAASGDLEPPALEPPAFGPEEASARALARADVRAAEARVSRSEYSARVERLRVLPDLSLFGSFAYAGLASTSGPSFDDMAGFGHPVVSGGLALEAPIFGRRERLRVARVQAQLEADLASLEGARRRARLEAVQATEKVREARLRAEASERWWAIERDKQKAAEAEFERGRLATDLLIRVMGDARAAETALARAKTDLAIASAELALATGRLLDWLGGPRAP